MSRVLVDNHEQVAISSVACHRSVDKHCQGAVAWNNFPGGGRMSLGFTLEQSGIDKLIRYSWRLCNMVAYRPVTD